MKITLKGKRVLLVEDNDLNREVSKSILLKEHMIVDEAADGKIAIEKVSQSKDKPYDFVLMDIVMPEMDGYEATEKIRSLPDHDLAAVPIVAMSAKVSDEDKKKSLEAGMNAHLTKPVNIEELLDTIKGFMGAYAALEGELSKLI